MKRTITVLVMSIICCMPALACDDEKVVKLSGVAVDRCITRNITMLFDKGNGKRVLITIDNTDGKRLYEALKPYYD